MQMEGGGWGGTWMGTVFGHHLKRETETKYILSSYVNMRHACLFSE